MANKIYLGNINISTAKLGSGDTSMYVGATKVYPVSPSPVQSCYDVTDNIGTYTGTSFEDVYDTTQSKWYKLNNLSQYEEYGVMGSGRSITYYEGKLTVDDGYEYQYSGSSWVNVGAVTGTSASLPDVTFSINYNAKDYDSSTSAFTKTSGQVIDHNPVVSGNAITVSSDHITVTGNSRAVIPSTYKSYLNRDSSNPNITVICKARTTKSDDSNILANRGGNYNWMYRQYTSYVTLHGTSQSFATLTFTDDGNPKICSTRVDSSRNLILNNWTDNTSSSGTGFTYGATNNDGAALFCGYSTTNNEYWGGDFYWVYMSQETLTDEQVQQVINYNENGSTIVYPVDYTAMQAPPTQVVFSSVSEMEDYQCVYEGLVGIVGDDVYIYTNGEWETAQPDTRYLHFEVLEDNFTFSASKAVSYSKNSIAWTNLAANASSPSFNSGDTIYIKATNTPVTSVGSGTFSTNGRFNVNGNPLSIIYGDNFDTVSSLTTGFEFDSMFKGCTGLTSASGLTMQATTLANYSYVRMFSGCTNLTDASFELPASTISNGAYKEMFRGCTSLTAAPIIRATSCGTEACNSMFRECSSLVAAPELPAARLEQHTYLGMFKGCTSLTAAPSVLPATTLLNQSYYGMFDGCTSLTAAPTLSATTLASRCCMEMFKGCTSLTTAPTLSATTLASESYRSMFSGCTSLNSITCLATDISATYCTKEWVNGVSSTGTFTKADNMTSWTTGVNGIPSNWTVQDMQKPFDEQYLTFEAIDSGTFKFSENSVSYSLDNGTTWTTLASNTDSPTVTAGSKIMWKGTLTPINGIGKFSSTAKFNAMGNIMSLLHGDEFVGKTSFGFNNKVFQYLFLRCYGLVSAENVILPATTLTYNCYEMMFSQCTGLTTAPSLPATTLAYECYKGMFGYCYSLTTAPSILPATTLAQYCYSSMFSLCKSLQTAPVLPATTLAQCCYDSMFDGCTSLTAAPSLPATTLEYLCYQSMFKDCTSLTTAPELPAASLAFSSYKKMFENCTSLNSITCLATNISAGNCTYEWVKGVSATGTFTKAASMTSWGSGSSGIPTNWTVQDYSS